ncbi:MAG TPA: translesion DNA synthesis-associated protein ImuA [Verrucomicrobiae bacterium]|nr:translesion DNA synthesis-associated protein ImuA [Verrucomicrobiae bacterium]
MAEGPLAELLRREPRLWRGGAPASPRTESTGFSALDRLLPGGGWPVGGLTELYPTATGIGEFTLLLPLLARLTQAGRRVALVAPPYIPYSQALAWHGVKLDRLVLLSPERPADALWALEQTLASKTLALAVGWPSRAVERDVRRLQVAAETGEAMALLYRPMRDAAQASPAALRLRLAPAPQGAPQGLAVDLFKSRGGRPAAVTLPSSLPTALPLRSAAA